MKLHPVIWIKKLSIFLAAALHPFGVWGLAGLALIDSALFPLPTSMDGTVWYYVNTNPHSHFPWICLVAAVASAIGSLVPYYVGRAGGELFLLKRINRDRYERMRDRFERQEFMAIMIPAMLPPPTPIKLFEFAAGVFEMKPVPFVLAILIGKYVQFMVVSILLILFGPAILQTLRVGVHEHAGLMWTIAGLLMVAIVVWMLRKLFNRRSGNKFPVEESDGNGANS